MAYVNPDYETKKAFKQAVKDGIKHKAFINGSLFSCVQNGEESIEGPHYPKPHKWYARVIMKDGFVVEVK